MKKSFKLISFSSILMFLIVSCGSNNDDDTAIPANSTGSISAEFKTTIINKTTWAGNWVTSLLANAGNVQFLTINGQISEKIDTEGVAIGISSFTGIGTYNYGGANDKVTFSAKFNNMGYTINTLIGGGGTGTIKITEFVKANGILNPGKAVGEFSGTVKSINSTDVLTIENGRFTSVIVL